MIPSSIFVLVHLFDQLLFCWDQWSLHRFFWSIRLGFICTRLSPDNFVYRDDGLAGVSFINLSLGFRLSNRNQTILQGFAFLNNYQRLCKHSQASSLSCLSADEVDSGFLGVCSLLMPRSGDIRKYTEVSWTKHKYLHTGSCERAPLWSQVGYTV
jgi:hypothetical protein